MSMNYVRNPLIGGIKTKNKEKTADILAEIIVCRINLENVTDIYFVIHRNITVYLLFS